MSEFSFEQLQQMRVANIQSQFVNSEELQKGEQDDLEKARHGVYADTPYNRKLNRVGQEYGHKAEEKQPSGQRTKKTEEASGTGGKTVADHAADTDSKVLKKVVDDPKAKPELKEAAQAELKKRGEDFQAKEDPKQKAKEEKKRLREEQKQKAKEKKQRIEELGKEDGVFAQSYSHYSAVKSLLEDPSYVRKIVSQGRERELDYFKKEVEDFESKNGDKLKYIETGEKSEQKQLSPKEDKQYNEILNEMRNDSSWASKVESMSGLDFSNYDNDEDIIADVKKKVSFDEIKSAYKGSSGKDFEFSEEDSEEGSTGNSEKHYDDLFEEMGNNSSTASAMESMLDMDFSNYNSDDEIKEEIKKKIPKDKIEKFLNHVKNGDMMVARSMLKNK